ncbi:thioredoxin [miscellaneous Crenarchaeota group-15 archaeon DG-45]|uniref:Thioredoxin n=1 Tax=miscellaneous Crenarchaeota group-15 archaeon DG-45 TaxID=1685127 RepID=A0A0M0BNV7_9ARCH|nr:MAG: thioredoxin [miscellaneous Crenarchaeota group-15 archaeon DG-45]
MTPSSQGRGPVEVTDDTFDAFVAGNRAAAIDCWAAWCPPCRILSPVFEQLAEENGEISFGKLNVDENPAIAVRFGIMSIPTILYFKDGKLVDKTIGALPKDAIDSRLRQLLP